MKNKMQRQWSRVSNFSMDLDCGDKCMKYTIFLVNGLFAVSSIYVEWRCNLCLWKTGGCMASSGKFKCPGPRWDFLGDSRPFEN